MNRLTSLIVNYATGYENAMHNRVSSVEVDNNIISIRFSINANQALYHTDVVRVFANASLNTDTNKIEVVTENGKGSRKYNAYIKRECESLVKLFISEALKQLEVEDKEAKRSCYDSCHLELLSMIDTSDSTKKNICYGYINEILDLYQINSTVEEMQSKLIEVKNAMLNDAILFDKNSVEVIAANPSNILTNTYTAYNRSFSTYDDAYNYCVSSDFDETMIQTIEASTMPQHALQLDLQLFNNSNDTDEQEQHKPFKKPYATYENGVSKFGIGKMLDLVYTIETTALNPILDDINYSNIQQHKRNNIHDAIKLLNLYQRQGYHNLQLWTEVRYKGETIIENGSESQLEFDINDLRLKHSMQVEKENEQLMQQLSLYQSFIEHYKAEKTYESFVTELNNKGA